MKSRIALQDWVLDPHALLQNLDVKVKGGVGQINPPHESETGVEYHLGMKFEEGGGIRVMPYGTVLFSDSLVHPAFTSIEHVQRLSFTIYPGLFFAGTNVPVPSCKTSMEVSRSSRAGLAVHTTVTRTDYVALNQSFAFPYIFVPLNDSFFGRLGTAKVRSMIAPYSLEDCFPSDMFVVADDSRLSIPSLLFPASLIQRYA